MNQLFYKLIFFLFLVLYAEKNAYSQEHLFRIEAGGNIGYINEKGKEIIKPKFHGAGDFSEGLAPARLKERMAILTKQVNLL